MIYNLFNKNLLKIFVLIFLIIILNFFLAPISWEPGMESLKNWAAAKIYSETFGFPVLSITPLYNLYLQFFLLFDAPLALRLEHFITNTFACFTLFLFLNKFVSKTIAILILSIWIPWLWGIEAGARIFALGFFNLYFAIKFGNFFNRGSLPVVLLLAALCDNAYLIFLLFHFIFYFAHMRFNKIKFNIKNSLNINYFIENMIIIFFITILILTYFFQSDRVDNNVHVFNYPWSPVPQKSILTVAFFQCIDSFYSLTGDWYFTHSEVFQNASNIIEGFLNNPQIVLFKFFDNTMRVFSMVPIGFVFGFQIIENLFIYNFLKVLFWFIFPIILFALYKYYKKLNITFFYVSILVSTVTVIFFLLLTCSSERYFSVLLPVGLLYFVMLIQLLKGSNYIKLNEIQNKFINDHRIKICLSIFLILIFLNPITLSKFISQDGILEIKTIFYILFFDIILFLVLIVFFFHNNKIIKKLNIFRLIYFSKKNNFLQLIFMIFLFLLVNSNSYYLNNFKNFTLVNPYELNNINNPRIKNFDKINSLIRGKKSLSADAPFLHAFSDIDINETYHVLYLPPFRDDKSVEIFLDSLDIIMISELLAKPSFQLSTQTYLRYKMHLEPYLEKNLNISWKLKKIEGFGDIYIKNK